jgi:hypothetical protein
MLKAFHAGEDLAAPGGAMGLALYRIGRDCGDDFLAGRAITVFPGALTTRQDEQPASTHAA